jgi:uncharacterized protein YbjQ (UPF0145 family)
MTTTPGRAKFSVPSEPVPRKEESNEGDSTRPELLGGMRPEVNNKILVTASDSFDGYEIMSYVGICWGISVRAKDLGQDCLMGCKDLTGGELDSYAELGDESRQRALDRMFTAARRQRANAIINFRFELSPATHGVGGVVAFGTGVVIKPIPDYIPLGATGAILRDIAEQLKKS